MHPTLEGFVGEYHAKGVPPPYTLLVGKDDEQNASIAGEFARKLATDGHSIDCATIKILGDLTMLLTGNKVVFVANVQTLKREFVDRLVEALSTGDVKFVIGQGPAARTHVLPFTPIAFMASCTAKHDCPASLLKQFRCVIPVDPYTPTELQAVLEAEAGKDRISFEPGAAELLVRCSKGLSSLLLNRFKKVVALIDQKTNKPYLTVEEVRTALVKLRIEIPEPLPLPANRTLDDLTGVEFESLIKALLIEMGFQAELTEVTGDGGIDIVALLDRPFSGGRYIFQCKRYSEGNLVGAPAIRDFYGAVMADRAVKGIFITTSEFTTQAKEFASQSGIELVNRARLNQILEKYKVHTI
jgi:hypothetical protein